MNEEQIRQELIKTFSLAEDKVRVQRSRRVYAEVARQDFEKLFVYARNTLKFNHLIAITGFDEAENLAFLYHLSADNGIVLNIRTVVSKVDPSIRTITGYFPSADICERELVDLFGAKVEGLEPGNRYPLTDEWPKGEYPLRKDWKAGGAKERAA